MNPFFENNQIFPDELPATEVLDFQRLHGSHKNQIRISLVVFFLLLFVTGIFIMIQTRWLFSIMKLSAFFLGAILVFSLLMIWAGIIFRNKKYAIRQKDVNYNSGVIFKKKITIPYNRIQHCDVRRGITDQLLDLSKLNIYTAGGSSSDITVPGLHEETAERLKKFILTKTSKDEEE